METYLSIRIFVLICLFGLLIYTIHLIRSNKLSAHLAVSWVLTEIIFIFMVSIDKIITTITWIVGEKNFYTIAFLFVIGWIILLMLDTLSRVSDTINKARSVIQENSLLRERVDRLEEVILILKDEVNKNLISNDISKSNGND